MNKVFTVLLAQEDANYRHEYYLVIRRNYSPLTVHEASDGMEVTEYLQGKGKFADRENFPIPDLLILDLHIPKVSGLEILRWVRNHPKYCLLFTVLVSGSGTKNDIAEAYRLGACSYFKTPRNFSQFMKMLNAIFDYWRLNEKLDDRAFEPALLPPKVLEMLH